METSKVCYNFLGRSGLKVSNICLSTLTIGKGERFKYPTQADEELSFQILDRFAELGGNFIDTANTYGPGKSEEILGNWLKRQDRSKFVVATKVGLNMDYTTPNKVGLARSHILEACEASLGRLQLDYIDLYQYVFINTCTPLFRKLAFMEFKRKQTPDATSSRIGFTNKAGIALQHFASWKEIEDDNQYWNLIDVLDTVAKAKGKTVAQISLRWLLQRKNVVSIIIGATTLAQLNDNMEAGNGWELSEEEMKTIEDASLKADNYPYEMLKRRNGDRINPCYK